MLTIRHKPAAEISPATSNPTGCLTPLADRWLSPLTTLQLNAWIIDRLRLQPYQHVLEIGSGTGRRLEAAARTLRIGFLAGVEPSPQLHQQACRRNKRFIARQLIQLHLGDLPHLPYPPHYFHTVFTTSAILLSKYPEIELLRLIRLLRSGGRLVLFFQQKTTTSDLPARIQKHYTAAALPHPEIESYPGPHNSMLAAIITTP